MDNHVLFDDEQFNSLFQTSKKLDLNVNYDKDKVGYRDFNSRHTRKRRVPNEIMSPIFTNNLNLNFNVN